MKEPDEIADDIVVHWITNHTQYLLDNPNQRELRRAVSAAIQRERNRYEVLVTGLRAVVLEAEKES